MSKLVTVIVASLLTLSAVACGSEVDTSSEPKDDASEPAPMPTVDTDTIQPAYGSTYSSNCYCLSCSLYCSVNGKTEKAGTCC